MKIRKDDCKLPQNYVSMRHFGMSIQKFMLILTIGLCCFPHSGVAQETISVAGESSTAADPEISLDELKVLLRPLSKSELEIELEAWLNLLQSKIAESGEIELRLVSMNSTEDGAVSFPVKYTVLK